VKTGGGFSSYTVDGYVTQKYQDVKAGAFSLFPRRADAPAAR